MMMVVVFGVLCMMCWFELIMVRVCVVGMLSVVMVFE